MDTKGNLYKYRTTNMKGKAQGKNVLDGKMVISQCFCFAAGTQLIFSADSVQSSTFIRFCILEYGIQQRQGTTAKAL